MVVNGDDEDVTAGGGICTEAMGLLVPDWFNHVDEEAENGDGTDVAVDIGVVVLVT